MLRKLLDVTRHAAAELPADEKKRPGNELPDDVKQKFEELRQKLEKFLAAAEESDRGQREPGEEAGRGFTKPERGVAQKDWRRPRRTWSKFMGEAAVRS